MKKMIESIAHNPIPNNGMLINPLKSKKQTGTRQTILTDVEKYPVDIAPPLLSESPNLPNPAPQSAVHIDG
jgi:hypothetical protein